jgi:hypothetical protein
MEFNEIYKYKQKWERMLRKKKGEAEINIDEK